jgi:hypothetical protein
VNHIKFELREVPVAQAMLVLAEEISLQPIQQYFCYWTAFNNIYTLLAERRGCGPQVHKNKNSSVRYRTIGGFQMADVGVVPESKKLDLAFAAFSQILKDALIQHKNTSFFVYRRPVWRTTTFEFDKKGQRVNGVINMNRTTHSDYPVWTPIDTNMYEKYIESPNYGDSRDVLSRQILDLLYTIRNNLVHGGKRYDDVTDEEVLFNALPLLKMIVLDFIVIESPI